jgi:hypothetical protein
MFLAPAQEALSGEAEIRLRQAVDSKALTLDALEASAQRSGWHLIHTAGSVQLAHQLSKDILLPSDPTSACTRTGDLSQALDVYYGVDGTAIAGNDFSGATGVVHFAVNSGTAVLSLAVTDDTSVESAESVGIHLLANTH